MMMIKHFLLCCVVISCCSCATYRTYNSLDKALDNPSAVQRLKISNKELGSLPSEIGRLTNLKELILIRVHIDSLPAEISRLTELEYLAVSEGSKGGAGRTTRYVVLERSLRPQVPLGLLAPAELASRL